MLFLTHNIANEKQWQRQYFDFLCSDIETGKADHHVVRSALQWFYDNKLFANKTHILTLLVWSYLFDIAKVLSYLVITPPNNSKIQ